MINSLKKLYAVYTIAMVIMAAVSTFVVKDSWGVYYAPYVLCAIVWAIFMFSYTVGDMTDTSDGYKVLFRYMSGAAVRMVGVLAVIFYPVLTAEKGQYDGMNLILCVMVLYALSMFLYLMKIKNAAKDEAKC